MSGGWEPGDRGMTRWGGGGTRCAVEVVLTGDDARVDVEEHRVVALDVEERLGRGGEGEQWRAVADDVCGRWASRG